MDRTLTPAPQRVARKDYRALIDDRRGLLDADRYEAVVAQIAHVIADAFSDGHRVYWCGNGGSAADAQHLAAEFSGRFLRERRGLPSEALSVNSSAVTAIANDYGYDRVFARQIEAFARPGDVVVAISTTGNSPNLVNALQEARKVGATTIAFSGNGGGKMTAFADIALVGPDGYSALVQEIHITLGHIVCDLVEQAVFPDA